DRVLVRYGKLDKNNYFFFGVEGESSVPCSNFTGNPSNGDSKQCWYNEDSASIPTSSWNECASERGDCDTGVNEPIWIKYGADAKWLYTVQSGSFTCDNDHFGWDPNKGTHKSCWVGYPLIYSPEPDWTTCATEGQTCDLTTTNFNNTGIMIRYGVNNSWNYKIATQSDSFDCTDDNFGDPAVGTHKACGVTSYLESAVVTQGKWNKIGDCGGVQCSTSFAVTWGSTWASSVTNQQTWSVGVTDSVTAGIAIPPEKAEETIGYSESYANSTTYQQSLSDTYSETFTVNCGTAGVDEYKAVYQFATSSAADCLTGTGQCSSDTHTQDYICYTGDQELSTPPQCLPNACANAYCTECKPPIN
ncbi:hypothetical protein ACFL2V_22330, partial [Pseudomonadota bacterium]